MIVPYWVEDGEKGIFGSLGVIMIASILLVGSSLLNLHLKGVEFSNIEPTMFIFSIFYHTGPLHLIVAAYVVYIGGVLLEARGGFVWYIITFLIGGIIGELVQVLIFSNFYPNGFVNGMEGGGLSTVIAGAILWNEEKITFYIWPKHQKESKPWLWVLVSLFVVIAYYTYMNIYGGVAGWGVLIGGIIAGVAMVPVLGILGVKEAYTTLRMRAETDAVINNVINTLSSESRPRESTVSDNPIVLEERMRERFNRGDINGASLDAVKLMDLFLRRNRPDEARRIFVFVEEFIGEIRIPGRILLSIADHCLDLALVDEAIDIAHRVVITDFDTPGLDKFLFRLIEVLVDTSSADFDEAEFFLSRYRLLSTSPQNYEYLRGKLYQKKSEQELTDDDRYIMKMISSEYYEQALDAIRERGDDVRVPPEDLLILARGLLMMPSVEDAAEVLAIIAHLHPESAETPEAVYQLIQIFQEHLFEEDRAISWYNFLRENFPNAPATTLAKEYLDKIRRQRLKRS